jgi:dienelactone hydrolase
MSGKLPLVVWFHPSSSSAERVASDTSLLKGNYNNTAQFGAAQTGFILLAPQGRYTSHYYPGNQTAATGWDVWYRQTGPDQSLNGTLYRTNVDFAATDHFIDELVAAGRVDASRIYSMGWSAGASMSYLYGLNRSRIAGVAAYTAVDPLATFNDPCKQTPTATAPASISELQLSNPRVPIYHLHNTCDLWAECPNMLRLNQRLGGIAADKLISGGFKKQVQEPDGVCDASCGTNPDGDPSNRNGVLNHDRWPGDWVTDMLDFLAQQQTSN